MVGGENEACGKAWAIHGTCMWAHAYQHRRRGRRRTAGDELLLDGDAGGGDHGEAAVVELLVAVVEEGLLVLGLDDLQGVQALDLLCCGAVCVV